MDLIFPRYEHTSTVEQAGHSWLRRNLGSALCTVFPPFYLHVTYLYECIILVIVAMVVNVIILIVLSLFASHSGFFSIAARCIFLCFPVCRMSLSLCTRKSFFFVSPSVPLSLFDLSSRFRVAQESPEICLDSLVLGRITYMRPYMRGDRTIVDQSSARVDQFEICRSPRIVDPRNRNVKLARSISRVGRGVEDRFSLPRRAKRVKTSERERGGGEGKRLDLV